MPRCAGPGQAIRLFAISSASRKTSGISMIRMGWPDLDGWMQPKAEAYFPRKVQELRGRCRTCSRKGRHQSSVSPRTQLVSNSPWPISMGRLMPANRLPPIASFRHAPWPKQVLRRRLHLALKNTKRPALVAVKGALCQSSAAHSTVGHRCFFVGGAENHAGR